MKLIPLIAAIVVLAGCRTATTPGSVYRQTDRILDLLAEPTFDVGADPAESRFYSFRVPHSDADGHGIYDVFFVVTEQLWFSPVWLCSAGYWLVGGESYFAPQAAGPAGPTGNYAGQTAGTLRAVGAYAFAIPAVGFYWMATVTVTSLDMMFHDVPVITIGRPLRWIWENTAQWR